MAPSRVSAWQPFPKIAVREKILFFLAGFSAADVGLPSTQVGIANAISLHRGHVSRALVALGKEGLVVRRRVRVTGFQRALLVFGLSRAGEDAVATMRRGLEQLLVEVRVPGAPPVQKTLGQALPGATARDFWNALGRLEVDGYLSGDPLREAAPQPGFVREVDEMPVVGGFVGRTADLARLVPWLRSTGPSCMVLGPGGIGKSTLVAWAIQQARPARHVLWVRVLPGMTPEAFLAHVDRLLAKLGRSLLKSPSEPLATVLERLPARLNGLPLLVAIDDAHKATPDLDDVFERLAHAAARGTGLQVVWIGRTLHIPVEAVRRAVRLDLGPLAPAERKEALQALAVPEDRCGFLAQRSGGNPLFLELLAAGGSVEDASEGFVRHLTESLATRGPRAQQDLLQLMSALRTPVARTRLETLAQPVDVEALLQTRVLTESADRSLGLHDEVREVVYASLGDRERRRIHATWAQAFGPAPDSLDDAVEYLHHLTQAGRQTDAAWWTLRNQMQLLDWARQKFRQAGEPTPRPQAV